MPPAGELTDFEIIIPFTKDVSAGGELRLFGGIASSTKVDRDLERLDKAVLPKIASDLKKNSTVFFNHNTKGLGVGTVANAEVRGEEVYVDVTPTKAAGMQDVVTQIKEGVLKSFSIGGKIVDWENVFDEKLGKNVRVIKDVDCYEVSVVGVPANIDASILSHLVKSFKGGNVAEDKPKEGAQTEVQKTGDGTVAPGTGLEKCSHTMVKCAKCNKELAYKPEPEGGPGELKVKAILESPDFKKVLDDFDKATTEKVDAVAKSYEKKLEEESLARKAVEARIEELHKALSEHRGKALASDTETLHEESAKAGETAVKPHAALRNV